MPLQLLAKLKEKESRGRFRRDPDGGPGTYTRWNEAVTRSQVESALKIIRSQGNEYHQERSVGGLLTWVGEHLWTPQSSDTALVVLTRPQDVVRTIGGTKRVCVTFTSAAMFVRSLEDPFTCNIHAGDATSKVTLNSLMLVVGCLPPPFLPPPHSHDTRCD